MRYVIARFVVASLFLFTTVVAFADDAQPTTQAVPPIQWLPITGMDHQLFPSATISTATSKESFAYLVIKVSNIKAGSKVHATVKCDSLIDPSSVDIVPSRDASVLIVPIKANWKFDQLARVRQQIPANFTYSLAIDGQELGEKMDTATVHSVNDCLYELRDGAGNSKAFYPLFAAYVNEDHPQIDKILKVALATGIVKQFDGYQANDPTDVVRQVFAIWHTLQLKGIRYSDITDTPNESMKAICQHVRFLDESIDNDQANCVDGSVLFASALQKIGLDAGLVIIPNHHMFVIFYTDAARKHPIFLETTMLGLEDIPQDRRNNTVENFLAPAWKKKASAQTFIASVKKGASEIEGYVAEEQKRKATGNEVPAFVVVYIQDARKHGIMPIPFQEPAK